MVRYEINYACKGVELYFNSKPNEKVLNELRTSKWRWHSRKFCWYTFDSVEHRNQAIRICNLYNNKLGYGNVASKDVNTVYKTDILSWELESVLKKNGYSVSQQDGLTPRERQRILSQVIINKIMSPIKVIKHIELQIKLKEGNKNFLIACKKWREDINFIEKEFLNN